MIQGIMYHDYTIVKCEVYRRFKVWNQKKLKKKHTHTKQQQ